MNDVKLCRLTAILFIVCFWTRLDADIIRVPFDHNTIQDAIDAAQPGDTVLVSAGTYQERIKLKSRVILKSAGDDSKGELGLLRAEKTIIDGGGNRRSGPGVTMALGATLDGFTITKVGVYDEAQWNKHHRTQGNDQKHEPIGEPGEAGIGVVGVTCTVQNNIVHHVGYSGIGIEGVDGQSCSPFIYRNICYRNMGGGIGSMKKSAAVIKQNVCFQNFYAGIGHDNASPTVIGNQCYENIRAGIGISEGACPVVRHNKCFRNRRAGIGTRTGGQTRPIIEDNDCYENDMAGIGTDEQASPIIRNNRCFKNKLAGIGARNQASPVIVGNECYENEKAGIGQESDATTTLIGNFCHHNKAAGIGFAPCEKGRSTVLNNRLIENSKVAIGIHSGWNVRVSGNELSRKGGLPPMMMVFQGATATITDNTIRSEGVAGIRAAGKIRVVRNDFQGLKLRPTGPPNFAVWALPGSEVIMTGNEIRNWRHGLHASESTVVASHNQVADFHVAAFLIQNSPRPADVFGNTIVTTAPLEKAISISGLTGVVEKNRVQKPAK